MWKFGLLTFLTNYQNGELRNGREEALQELFELYRFGLEQDILVEGRYWATQHFINAIVCACGVGKTDWASDFIRENNFHKRVKIPNNKHQTSKKMLKFGRVNA